MTVLPFYFGFMSTVGVGIPLQRNTDTDRKALTAKRPGPQPG